MRRRLGLWAVLAGLVGATIYLHRLASDFPLSSLRTGPLDLTLGTLARLVGLAVAYWLLGSSVLLILARLSALPAAIRAISPLTWAPVRKLIESSVASSLVIALAGPAAQAAVEPGYVPVPAGDPLPASNTPSLASTTTTATLPITIVEPVDSLYLPIEAAQPVAIATSVEAIEVRVRPGDNMWLLAERRLREIRGGAVTDADIAPYWLAVIAANHTRIRSGDPDLIFPGEVLTMPEWG